MIIGVLVISDDDFLLNANLEFNNIAKHLSSKGHDVKTLLSVASNSDIKSAVEFASADCGALLVMGNTKPFLSIYKDEFSLEDDMDTFSIDSQIFIVKDIFTDEYIIDTVIPTLNSKSKTFYTARYFKTFGLTVDEVKLKLKDFIKNKNRITFRFTENNLDCLTEVRYSNKAQMPIVEDLMSKTATALKDNLYSLTNESLAEVIITQLQLQNKTIAVAESFTGGGLTKALVGVAGASKVVCEGIVSYSNMSKINRLKVDPQIIENYSAVSIEAVYEMAANLLMYNKCDYTIATTGYAGPPTDEFPKAGEFFIAVGSLKSIDIDKFCVNGSREKTMELGINCALHRIYKKLKENDFDQILSANKMI